jgi:peroxiredoxin
MAEGGKMLIVSRIKSFARVAVFMCLSIFFLSPVCTGQIDKGQTAPDFILPDLFGEKVRLKDLRGKIVLLDFWATWCLPCRKTLPEMAALDKKYRDDGVVVLGLSIDDPASYDNRYVREFKDKYGVEYQILRTHKGVVASYLGTENVRIPTLFIVDREGKIVEKHEGLEQGTVEKTLKALLSEKE